MTMMMRMRMMMMMMMMMVRLQTNLRSGPEVNKENKMMTGRKWIYWR